MKYNPLTRRMFLQGMGGYALAIPLLPSLLPRAQAAEPVPMRFAMCLGQLGRDISQWYPNLPDNALQQVNGVLALPLSQVPKPISYTLGAFTSLQNKITVARGLDCLSTQGNHNSSVPTTGSSVDPSSALGFGYSIDSVLEESAKFYTNRPVTGALRTCPDVSFPWHDFSSFSYTSKATRGQRIAYDWSPIAVYNRLLNPTSIQANNARNGRIRNVTNLVMDSYRATMGSRSIAAADKQRLDNYMGLLSDTHNQLGVVAALCGNATPPTDSKTLSEIHKAMMKVEVAALACGTTKIVMHIIAHATDGDSTRWHDYAHGGQQTINGSTGRSYLSEYNRYSMDLVAFFLSEMDKINEANGKTLLDNTLFMYGNEDGTGSHEHFDLPVLLAGGQGRLRMGQYIDFRPRPLVPLINRNIGPIHAGRPYNNMLVTALQAFGLTPNDYQKFGEQGFGRYDKPSLGAGPNHYLQYLGAKVNDPLPYLWVG